MISKKHLPKILSALVGGAGAVFLTSVLRLMDHYEYAMDHARLTKPIIETLRSEGTAATKMETREEYFEIRHSHLRVASAPSPKEVKWLIYSSGSLFLIALALSGRFQTVKLAQKSQLEPWESIPPPTLKKRQQGTGSPTATESL